MESMEEMLLNMEIANQKKKIDAENAARINKQSRLKKAVEKDYDKYWNRKSNQNVIFRAYDRYQKNETNIKKIQAGISEDAITPGISRSDYTSVPTSGRDLLLPVVGVTGTIHCTIYSQHIL